MEPSVPSCRKDKASAIGGKEQSHQTGFLFVNSGMPVKTGFRVVTQGINAMQTFDMSFFHAQSPNSWLSERTEQFMPCEGSTLKHSAGVKASEEHALWVPPERTEGLPAGDTSMASFIDRAPLSPTKANPSRVFYSHGIGKPSLW